MKKTNILVAISSLFLLVSCGTGNSVGTTGDTPTTDSSTINSNTSEIVTDPEVTTLPETTTTPETTTEDKEVTIESMLESMKNYFVNVRSYNLLEKIYQRDENKKYIIRSTKNDLKYHKNDVLRIQSTMKFYTDGNLTDDGVEAPVTANKVEEMYVKDNYFYYAQNTEGEVEYEKMYVDSLHNMNLIKKGPDYSLLQIYSFLENPEKAFASIAPNSNIKNYKHELTKRQDGKYQLEGSGIIPFDSSPGGLKVSNKAVMNEDKISIESNEYSMEMLAEDLETVNMKIYQKLEGIGFIEENDLKSDEFIDISGPNVIAIVPNAVFDMNDLKPDEFGDISPSIAVKLVKSIQSYSYKATRGVKTIVPVDESKIEDYKETEHTQKYLNDTFTTKIETTKYVSIENPETQKSESVKQTDDLSLLGILKDGIFTEIGVSNNANSDIYVSETTISYTLLTRGFLPSVSHAQTVSYIYGSPLGNEEGSRLEDIQEDGIINAKYNKETKIAHLEFDIFGIQYIVNLKDNHVCDFIKTTTDYNINSLVKTTYILFTEELTEYVAK